MTSLGFRIASHPREGGRLRVAPRPGDGRRGIVSAGAYLAPCALGRAGIAAGKREGDGATPRAGMRVLAGFFRADRWPIAWRRPWMTPLPARAGWCDAPGHPAYNRPVCLPFAASHEVMARQDGLYDCVIVLDWNIAPRARHRGSAIFMHLARDGFAPTEGCIALTRRDMARLLRLIAPGTRVDTR